MDTYCFMKYRYLFFFKKKRNHCKVTFGHLKKKTTSNLKILIHNKYLQIPHSENSLKKENKLNYIKLFICYLN